MKFDLLAVAITCVGCNARGHVKQTLIRNDPDEKKPVFCAVDDEGGFWKLETTGLPEGWREGDKRRPLCPACPDAAALPPPAVEPSKVVQRIAQIARPATVRPNSLVAQQGVQTSGIAGVARANAATSIPAPAAGGGQRVTVQQTHRAVSGSVATARSSAPAALPAVSALRSAAPEAQARVIGGTAHGATRAEVMPPGAIPASTAAKVSAPSPIARPQTNLARPDAPAPVAQSAKTEIVSIEPLPPKQESEPTDDELVAALASENDKQEVA